MITGGFGYTLQIRPYGVLLGTIWGGDAELADCSATRRSSRRRTGCARVEPRCCDQHALLRRSISAAALCGELVRVWQRRRSGCPMLLRWERACRDGIFLLPFLKGAAEFREHYKAGSVSYRSITQTYNFLLLETVHVQPTHESSAGDCAGAVDWAGSLELYSSAPRQNLSLPDAEFVFLLTSCRAAGFRVSLGHFVTHAMESRYCLRSDVGIAACRDRAGTGAAESGCRVGCVRDPSFRRFGWGLRGWLVRRTVSDGDRALAWSCAFRQVDGGDHG